MLEFRITTFGLHLILPIGPLSWTETRRIGAESSNESLLSPLLLLKSEGVRRHVKKYKVEEGYFFKTKGVNRRIDLQMESAVVSADVQIRLFTFSRLNYGILQLLILPTGSNGFNPDQLAGYLLRAYYKAQNSNSGSSGETMRTPLQTIVEEFLKSFSLSTELVASALENLPYPILTISEYEPSELNPQEIAVKFKREVFGLMVHPSYGMAKISEDVVVKEMPHNYFYSDLVYQDFHLRGAIMLYNSSDGFEEGLASRYESEFLRSLIYARLLWYTYQSIVSARANLRGLRRRLGAAFKHQRRNLTTIYYLSSIQYSESSKVYRDIASDAMNLFGTTKGIDEVARLIDSIFQDNFQFRIELIGGVIAVLAAILGIIYHFHL